MIIKENKIRKKNWQKPVIKVINLFSTSGGETVFSGEDDTYTPGS